MCVNTEMVMAFGIFTTHGPCANIINWTVGGRDHAVAMGVMIRDAKAGSAAMQYC